MGGNEVVMVVCIVYLVTYFFSQSEQNTTKHTAVNILTAKAKNPHHSSIHNASTIRAVRGGEGYMGGKVTAW